MHEPDRRPAQRDRALEGLEAELRARHPVRMWFAAAQPATFLAN